MGMQKPGRIGVYVRESRDDFGENRETIDTQRELLLDFAAGRGLGTVCSVYEDDNVSGSGFEREGIDRLREDVLNGRIDILLVKDLSRLGRNNAKTLQFLDFLEEHGVRVLSSDGRYDSQLGDDIVGIETWANERYIRDISRKIRSSLRFKIQRGEYVGHAPFGYRKAEGHGNRLFIQERQAETVRHIYGLYLSGLGYTTVAALLDEEGCPSPEGKGWNRITVRRILISPVYIGDTVQGISERISFKSKKARRLPEDAWVITQGTHEPIVSKEDFLEVQRLRRQKGYGRGPHKALIHMFHGLVRCGACGSPMYARKTSAGTTYMCGNYCRNGKKACKSHHIEENLLCRILCEEMKKLFPAREILTELMRELPEEELFGGAPKAALSRLQNQLSACRRQQDLLYADRLEERISEQLFIRTNQSLENRIRLLETKLSGIKKQGRGCQDSDKLLEELLERLETGRIPNEIVMAISGKITVYDAGDSIPSGISDVDGGSVAESGTVVFEFRMK